MGLFFLAKLSTKHLYFLAFSIFAFLRDVISYIDYNDYLDKGKENPKFKKQPVQNRYFDIITNIISDCLQGFFVLFHRIKAKNDILNNEANENLLEYPFYDEMLITKDKKENNSTFSSFLKIMTKICIVDFFCQFIFLLFSLIYDKDELILRKNNNYLLLVDISARFIFCRIILGTFFYKHHYFSMIINCGIFIILTAFDIHYIFKNISFKEVLYFIFLIIQTVAYSFEDVLNKIALTKESLSPYSLLFFKGLLEIPLLLITTAIVLPIQDAFNDFKSLDNSYKKYVLVRRAIFIVFNIFRSIFLVKVIDTFSSQHLSILKVLESIFMFLFFLIDGQYDKTKYYIPVISISFFITIFTSLIYNEILVVNLCGLQDYTKHGIEVQAEKDLRDAVSEINEMSNDPSESSESRNESIVVKNESFND